MTGEVAHRTALRAGRLGRNLRHLVLILEEPQALGIAFVPLSEAIEATTPTKKLQMHVLVAVPEFERARIGRVTRQN